MKNKKKRNTNSGSAKDCIEIATSTCKVQVWGNDLKEVEKTADRLMDKYGAKQ
jgi:hypothetical protein